MTILKYKHTIKATFRTLKIAVFFQFTAVSLVAQIPQKALDYNLCTKYFLQNPAEKIYLHTDRDIYSENDTIWFKAYLVNAHTLKPDNGPIRNVYVELINKEKEIAIRNMVAMKDGISFGDFILSNYKITKGLYVLRAYTHYQTNFDDRFIFEKNILITPFSNNQFYTEFYDSIRATISQEKPEQQYPDLQFLPEGGYLTSGLSNTLAFKAVNNNGNSIDVEGVIYESNNTEVTQFRTTHMGMGKINFKPEPGKTYYAKIDTIEKKYVLPEATDLLIMHVTNNTYDSLVSVVFRANSMDLPPAIYNVIATSRGLVSYYSKINVNTAYLKIRIPYSEFTSGINQITLLDSNFIPLRDRLIFVDKDKKTDVSISTDKQLYSWHDSVMVKLKVSAPDGSPVKDASLSVAVTDINISKNIEEYPGNILTSFLLSSDINGYIKDPAYYFDTINANDVKANLDLLLLTKGWSQYIWNPILDSLPEIKNQKQYGIQLSGKVSNTKGKKRKVTMTILDNENIFYDTITTNENGDFVRSNLILPDSVKAYFKCKKKKNEVSAYTFAPSYPVTKKPVFPMNPPKELSSFNQYTAKKYLEDKAYNPDKYNILLGEVEVNKKIDATKIEDGRFRPYPKVDYVFSPKEEDTSYENVLFYLSRENGKVKYDGNSLQISGISNSFSTSSSNSVNSKTPLLLLDGIEVEQIDLELLPMDVVDKVEVLSEPVSLIFWSHDSKANKNGVISVFTKQGSMYSYNDEDGSLHILRGYYQSRRFYTPKYNKSSQNERIDTRATLLWSPFINTDENGMATFTFSNTNYSTTIKISLEGISPNGNLIVGSNTYEVK